MEKEEASELNDNGDRATLAHAQSSVSGSKVCTVLRLP